MSGTERRGGWLWRAERERPEVDEVRGRILQRLLYVFALVGLPAVAIGIVQSYLQGRWKYSLAYAGIYLVFLIGTFTSRRLSDRLRALILVSTLFLLAFAVLARIGMSGVGMPLLIGVCFLSALLYGRRAGMAALLVSMACILYVASGMTTGFIEIFPQHMQTSTSWMAWSTGAFVFCMIAGVAVIAPDLLRRRIEESVDLLQVQKDAMEAVNERLHREVEGRRRTEEGLRESEARYRHLFHDHSAVKLLLDPEDGRIVDANAAAVAFYGWPQEILLRMGIQEINALPPEQVRAAMEKAGTGRQTHFVFRHRRADGSERDVEVFSSRIDILGKGYLHSIVHDITDRRLAQEALRESEANYRHLFDHAPAGIYRVDFQTGRFTRVNDLMAEYLGYGKDDLFAMSPLDLLTAESRQVFLQRMEGMARGADVPEEVEYEIVDRHGEKRWILLHNQHVRDDEGRVIASDVVAHDITERKRAERAVRESEEKYRTLAETAQDLIVTIDFSGVVTYANPAAVRLAGGGDIVGMPLRDLIPLDMIGQHRKMLEERVQGLQEGRSYEWVLHPRDGSGAPVLLDIQSSLLEHQGRPSGVLFVARDITERKRTEKALRESEERFRALAESARDCIWTMDLDLRLTYVSPYVKEGIGYTPEEFMRLPLEVYMTPDSLAACMRIFAEELDVEKRTDRDLLRSRTVEMETIHKDGRIVWAEVKLTFLRDDTGRAVGILGYTRDITERKQAENRLRESEAKYRFLTDKMNDVIWTADMGLQVDYVSPSIEKVLGFAPEEHLSRRIDEQLTPSSLSVMEGVFVRELAVEQEGKADPDRTLKIELEYFHRDGSTRWLAHVISGIRNERGVLVGIHGVARDVTADREIENRLRESEQRMRLALEGTDQGLWSFNLFTRKVRYSLRWQEILGYGPDESEFDYDWFIRQIHPESRVVFERALSDYLSGRREYLEWEYRIRNKEGDWQWIHALGIFVNFQTDGFPANMIGTHRNITARKRAEEAILLDARRTEVLLRLGEMTEAPLQEITDFCLEQAVALTQSRIGYLAFLDEAESVLTMHSWSKTAMAECAVEKRPIHCPVADTGLWGEAVRQRRPVITNDYAEANPWKKGYPEGHVRITRHMNVPVFEGSRLVVVAGVGNKEEPYAEKDVQQLTLLMQGMWRIVERKRVEEELRRLSIAVEQAEEDIVITDTEGVIQYVNPAFERITGFPRTEAIGMNPRILKSGVHGAAFYEHLWRTIRNGEIWTGRITNRRKDGRLIQEDATISPLITSAGRITGYVALKRDVTEAIKIESRLRQAQKMEAIGTLAGGIAHDFNNILAAIVGYAELVKFKTRDAAILPFIDQVLKACERSRDLVQQILTFSRKREQERKPMAVAPIVKEALKLLRSSLPTTVEIRPFYGTPHDTVFADPTQIHQVLMNLCTNAAHAMRDRGGILEVRLEKETVPAERRSFHPDLKAGDYLRLVVKDSGEGIDPAIKDKIFDPFFTTKRPGEGTGLGLSVVYGIVKDHDGSIAVDSEPGKGTVVSVHLPLLAVEGAGESSDIADLPHGEGSILYVDDEELIARSYREMLSSLGYDAAVCFSSRDALDLFRARPKRFDLVITDMTMPGMTGDVMAQEMLKLRPDLPIILTTGYSERIDPEAAKRAGIRDYLMKPVAIADLARAVKRIMEEREGPASGPPRLP